MSQHIKRLSFALLAPALLLVLLCGQAGARDQAMTTLKSAIDEVLDSIRNPAYANPATRGPLRQKIEGVVRGIFDFGEFSSRTAGPAWRKFSQDEKKRFENAFSDLLFNTYLNKITGYNGELVDYTGETVSPDGNRVEIRTAIQMKDGRKTPVFYRMLPKQGSWKVYDVIIENVSLVKNYRTQFQDILNTGTPDQLIARVQAKAEEVRQHPGQDANASQARP